MFLKNPKAPAHPFTRPAPFKLATDGEGPEGAARRQRAEARRQRAAREAAAAAFGECTFVPTTKAGRAAEGRRKEVAGILGGGNDEDSDEWSDDYYVEDQQVHREGTSRSLEGKDE